MAQDEVLNIARKYADAVRSTMQTKGVFLYGSYAKGTAKEDSDIDIAVVVDHIPGDYLNAVSRLWGLTGVVHEDIEPVLLTTADSQSGFLQTIQRTGIAL